MDLWFGEPTGLKEPQKAASPSALLQVKSRGGLFLPPGNRTSSEASRGQSCHPVSFPHRTCEGRFVTLSQETKLRPERRIDFPQDLQKLQRRART